MSAGVVIQQPGQKGFSNVGAGSEAIGMQPPGAGFAPMTIPQAVVPAGLPPGLAYLSGLDDIRIHQQMEMLEVLAAWEKKNRYSICNSQEQQFMFAKEETDCLTRQCCGPIRPFVMNITDNQGMNLIQLHRPLRCQGSCFWCCCLQEMEIHSPPGMIIGKVVEVWTFCVPKYKVLDNNQQCVFTIVGDCCYCKCCTDVVFKVFEGDSESDSQEVGQILKHWGGCREVCGQANDFSLKLPANMDLMKKALLFGATFLIDFNFFENKQ